MLARSLPYWPIDPSLALSPWHTFQLDVMRAAWAILPAACLGSIKARRHRIYEAEENVDGLKPTFLRRQWSPHPDKAPEGAAVHMPVPEKVELPLQE